MWRNLVCLALVALAAPVLASEPPRLVVFAASSLTEALDEVDAAFSATSAVVVKATYASTSTLARQIEHGAPAGVFVSADVEWSAYLAQRKLVGPRVDLFGNALVLIARRADHRPGTSFGPEVSLAAMLGTGRLAIGDPDHVPAGRYAKQLLERLGKWPDAENRLAPADSVRTAMAFVERGECPLGIVYATDAAASPAIEVIAHLPPAHDPIVYSAMLVSANASAEARAYLAWLQSAEAQRIFARHGFLPLPR